MGTPPPLRVAQIGTKHGHAAGKMAAMLKNKDVEVAGIFEPDPVQRAKVMGTSSYEGVHWYDKVEELLEDESIVMVAAESYNLDNLEDCSAIIAAGKHCWFDKPATRCEAHTLCDSSHTATHSHTAMYVQAATCVHDAAHIHWDTHTVQHTHTHTRCDFFKKA